MSKETKVEITSLKNIQVEWIGVIRSEISYMQLVVLNDGDSSFNLYKFNRLVDESFYVNAFDSQEEYLDALEMIIRLIDTLVSYLTLNINDNNFHIDLYSSLGQHIFDLTNKVSLTKVVGQVRDFHENIISIIMRIIYYIKENSDIEINTREDNGLLSQPEITELLSDVE